MICQASRRDELGMAFEFHFQRAGRSLIDALRKGSGFVGKDFEHRSVEEYMQMHWRSESSGERRGDLIHSKFAPAGRVNAGDCDEIVSSLRLQANGEGVCLGTELKFQFRGQIMDTKSLEELSRARADVW